MDKSIKNKLQKLSLTIILDAYVTKNAIEDFLSTDWTSFRQNQIDRGKNPIRLDYRMKVHLDELKQELDEIEEFLNQPDNIHFEILGKNRKFFDDNLPKHKRKIEWFRKIDRYTFDYNIFYSRGNNDRFS